MKRIVIISILIWCISAYCMPQSAQADAALDSTFCVIGGQVGYNVTLRHDKQQPVAYPTKRDTLLSVLEIVRQSKVDTTFLQNNVVEERLTYYITCFEDTLLTIPEQPFLVGQDTVYTQPLSVRFIQPFEIDTTQIAITDIKPPYTPPFYWQGYAKAIALLLLLIALLIGIYIWFKKFFAKPVMIEEIPPQVRRRNAYDVAMAQLNAIKDEKKWQQDGQQKQYHTELTDTIRQYIDDVFMLNTMEQPSSEILATIKHLLPLQSEALGKLKDILQLSDLVKFAKYAPLPHENEQTLNDAYQFVEMTRPAPEETETANNEQTLAEND